ncbi:Down syndrome cell adhesion molecule-like protein Dscam2 [Apis florea]|uniref:Down syndrome cell adhesion molecule-like protein Dscam2 n=1 Tax=Apis florea TaxID=7463 RepID=UPI0012FF0813|nr:Down syndrome cell adhesion molecule-like protein Dscam2 [Apis florea]
MASWPLRIVLLSSTLILVRGRGVVLDSQGPVLISEPRSSVEFSNETGAMIHCSAQGSPLPRIDWLMGDESPVLPIPHIREMLVNGSMYFLPFGAETYRHDVHSAVYRCQASNSVGRVLGREITVKAVVRQKYEVQVRDAYVLPGNTGVLRCEIPTFVKEYVAVTSWVRDSAYNIFPTPKSDDRHHMLPTGELLVFSVTSSDAQSSYRCRTVHRVTGDTVESSSYARLVVTDPHTPVPPRFNERVSPAPIRTGETIVLSCISQGIPPPMYLWFRESVTGTAMIFNSERIYARAGVLVLQSARAEDAGRYVCHANNTAGSEMVELEVSIISSLSIHLVPQQVNAAPQLLYKFIEQTIQPGPSVSLKCIATGNPTPHFSWTLDGFPLPQNDRFMIGQYVTVHGDVISHVNISVVHVEDGGEYRCTAANRMAKVHHSARLNIYGLPHVRPMGNYAAVAGETTVIKCPVAGFPIASITWEKDGKVLPTSRRQEVFPNGTLVLHHVDRSTDHGAYTCTAKNKQGRSDSQTVHIEVKVPPTIAPFSFNKDLSEGVRAQVTCMVEKGDPPFTIAWSKDGEAIAGPSPAAGFGNTGITGPRHTQTPAGLRVTNIDAHSSTIVIERVSAAHSGNYTCMARNSVAEVLWTAELIVRVPPRWVMEPQDVRASEGMSRLVLHCHADGFPPPAVSWRRASGKKPGNYRDIVTHEHAQNLRIHSNGSLVFGRVQEDHEGFYLCEAVNGIGAGLSKVVHLTVNVPAHFAEKHRNQTARLGSSASLRCEAKGDHPLKILWKKMGAHLEQKLSDYRYTLKEENTTDGIISTLEFISTSREDSARYFCIASNAYGRDEMTIHLYIQEPPDFPRNLHVIEKGSRYINISWTTSQDGNSPITQYIIEYKTDTGNRSFACFPSSSNLGDDSYSKKKEFFTVPPAAPLLHATSATSNSINVQWKNRDDGGAPIRGYILHYKRESGEWEEMKVSHKINSFVLSRLWCGNDYQMYLTAYNRIGMGSPSEIVKATTNGSKPENSPSNGDKFVTVNVSWITLHLSMWNDGGCPITHFELEYRKNGEDIWTLVSNNIEVQKTYTLSELQPGTTYDIRTRAHNNAGFSVAEYRITTLQPHISSTVPSVEIDQYIPQHTSVYSDLKLIIPLILSSLAIIAAAGAVFYCFRKRPFIGEMASLHDAQTAAALDNKQNMEQREQYYATVRKPLRSPIHEMGTLEKIPEYSEDIYPYATFQLEESVPPGGDSRCNSAAPLQTFVYHDPRLSTADTLQLRESDCNRYTKVRGGRSSSAPLHKTHKVSQGKSESEEYDTLGSDSDTEVGTSSRTESSNHLVDSHHSVSAADSRVHNFLYHGPESSTSTEPSPIFERKSFPGRGRSKMLQLARHTSEETRSNFGPISGFGNSKHQSSNSCSNRDQERDGSGNLFVPKLDPPSGFSDAFELSEAECDLDRGHTSQRNVRDFVIAV